MFRICSCAIEVVATMLSKQARAIRVFMLRFLCQLNSWATLMILQTRIILKTTHQTLNSIFMKFLLSLFAVCALLGCASPSKEGPAPEVVVVTVVPPVVSVVPKIPPRIGLALGGGAARGFAHVGVIQVLEEAGIRPSMVSGTYCPTSL